MIRTRDYVLLLLTIAFLLIGIGATLVESYREQGFFDTSRSLEFTDTADVDRLAVIPSTESESRAERLVALRKKIQSEGLVSIAAPAPETPLPEPVVATEITEPLLCQNYQPYAGGWPAGVRFEAVEGARIAYTTPTATSSASTTSYTPTRTVLLSLPVRSVSAGATNCIASDVIGLTVSGALITNDSAFAYAGWDATALIGYALDGYPIYGRGTDELDACGGRTVNGQYRYQISPESSSFIRCFSGVPVAL